MAIFDQIQAKHYNDIRKKVNSVLGTGSAIYGYGQSLTSTEVKAGQKIEKSHFDALRTDIDTCLRHQQGENSTFLDIPEINTDDIIYWDHIEGFNYMADVIVAGRDNIYEGTTSGGKTQQTDIISGGSRTLSGGWGSNVAGQRYGQQTYIVKWNNSNDARYFFNSGGDLRLVFNTSGTASNTKSAGWYSVVNQLKNYDTDGFKFTLANYREALAGNQTSFTVQIYDSTNPYTENYGLASFTVINPRTIRVLVQFVDNDSGDHDPNIDVGLGPFGVAVDETVTIDISSGLEYRTTVDAVESQNPMFTVANFTLPENTTFQQFESAGRHTFTVPAGIKVIQVLIAGGGGGGYYPDDPYTGGGGGGGGQALYYSMPVVPLETLDIYVGRGGDAGYSDHGTIYKPTDGEKSEVRSGSGNFISALGGKAGKGTWGGVSGSNRSGGVPARSQTYGAGGGGNGVAGDRMNGGNGSTYSLSSINVALGGGGGGGNSDVSGAAQYGGWGGGGDGATSASTFTAGNGTDGTGGGGGGAAATATPTSVVYAGRGGCGFVAIIC